MSADKKVRRNPSDPANLANNAGFEGPAPRRCSVCGLEGHDRRTCTRATPSLTRGDAPGDRRLCHDCSSPVLDGRSRCGDCRYLRRQRRRKATGGRPRRARLCAVCRSPHHDRRDCTTAPCPRCAEIVSGAHSCPCPDCGYVLPRDRAECTACVLREGVARAVAARRRRPDPGRCHDCGGEVELDPDRWGMTRCIPCVRRQTAARPASRRNRCSNCRETGHTRPTCPYRRDVGSPPRVAKSRR